VIYSIPEDLPTCPECGRPIRLATPVGDSAHVEPCGHDIPAGALRPAHVDESNDTAELRAVTDGGDPA
jgi:hypothetical protein